MQVFSVCRNGWNAICVLPWLWLTGCKTPSYLLTVCVLRVWQVPVCEWWWQQGLSLLPMICSTIPCKPCWRKFAMTVPMSAFWWVTALDEICINFSVSSAVSIQTQNSLVHDSFLPLGFLQSSAPHVKWCFLGVLVVSWLLCYRE